MSRYTRKVSSRLGRYERQKFGGFGHEGPSGRHLNTDHRAPPPLRSPEYWYHSCTWGKCKWIVKNTADEAVWEERRRQQQHIQHQMENQREREIADREAFRKSEYDQREAETESNRLRASKQISKNRFMLAAGAGGLVVVGLILVLALR